MHSVLFPPASGSRTSAPFFRYRDPERMHAVNSSEIVNFADARQTQEIGDLVKQVGVLGPHFACFAREIVDRQRFALIVVEANAAASKMAALGVIRVANWTGILSQGGGARLASILTFRAGAAGPAK